MRHWLSRLLLIFTIKCEQVAMLTSAAQDRALLRHEWLAVRGHQLSCWSCRQFEKHLWFLSKVSSQLAHRELAASREAQLRMPGEMREQLMRRCGDTALDDIN